MTAEHRVPAVGEGPQQGDYAFDGGQEPGRMGMVRLVTSRYVQMRSLNGTEEWDAAPRKVRRLSAREELSARKSMAEYTARW